MRHNHPLAPASSDPRRVALGPASFLPRQGFVVVPVLPGFKLADGTVARSALVGRSGGRLLAFANVCRHLAIPLDLGDGEVMDDERQQIVCHHHGAIFDPVTGECVVGPCYREFLWRWEVEIDALGDATLVITPAPPAPPAPSAPAAP